MQRAWLAAEYDEVVPADRQLLMTYCSFASSEADVFGALLNGASLHLYDVGSRGLSEFGAWINEHRITLLHPPVALFRRYLSMLDGRDLHPTVRLVMFAGEAVFPRDVQHWRDRFAPTCGFVTGSFDRGGSRGGWLHHTGRTAPPRLIADGPRGCGQAHYGRQ
jgi:non-ribosomal peptide synthetase component F